MKNRCERNGAQRERISGKPLVGFGEAAEVKNLLSDGDR